MSIREDILDHAKSAVMTDRNLEYGGPEENFRRIAALWSTYKGAEFSPLDVAVMMMLVKVARVVTSPVKEDHYIDIAGYAACAAEVADTAVAP